MGSPVCVHHQWWKCDHWPDQISGTEWDDAKPNVRIGSPKHLYMYMYMCISTYQSVVAPVLIIYPYSVAGSDVVAYMWHPEDGPDNQPIPTAAATVSRREDFPFDGELCPPRESTLDYNYTSISVHVCTLCACTCTYSHAMSSVLSLTSCSWGRWWWRCMWHNLHHHSSCCEYCVAGPGTPRDPPWVLPTQGHLT